ncbi:MAG: WbqC family protein, partial [Patescibacteria group bacterium]
MILTIHQPEYLPWASFFDRVQKSDVLIFLDDVGYQKNGFINRNKIKTKNGATYLTVPVLGRSPNLRINEVLIDNSKNWQKS